MGRNPMKMPDKLRKQLRVKWNRYRHNWLAGEGKWPLHLPVGRLKYDQVIEQWDVFDAWLKEWRTVKDTTFGRIEPKSYFKKIRFEQIVPWKWWFDTPEIVAAELNELPRWQRARRRFNQLAAWLDEEAITDASLKRRNQWRRVVSRRFDVLADMDDNEFELLVGVTDWIWRNLDSGLFSRQLPIPGIDSKWIERRRRLLTAWIWVLRGGSKSHNFYKVTGLRPAPDRLRMRLLDSDLRKALGGLSDIEAPVADFIDLRLPAHRVLIVENLVTGLTCKDLPGTLVFMGRGYGVNALGRLPWLTQLPVFYWGDIDTDGFAILSRLRGCLSADVQSLMMDEATFREFRHLSGRDDTPHAATELPHLTETEQRLYCALREGEYRQVRLEQERIAWDWAWRRVVDAFSS